MKIIIKAIQKTLQSFIYILMLLILFLFIYSLLGIQIFQGKFNFSDPFRQNFDNFYNAFISVFQVIFFFFQQKNRFFFLMKENIFLK